MKYDLTKYDFLDLGSKNGGSIKYCAKHFRTGKGEESYAKGIGIDIDPEAVKRARKAGIDTIEQDILKLDIEQKFKFVTALDFLEHLPGVEAMPAIIEKMASLASDFIFIRHPSFEDVEYLKGIGLKPAWADWSVHTAHAKIYDYTEIFNKLGLRQYCFVFRNEIKDSSHKYILPSEFPTDVLEYDKKLGPKKKVTFDKKVFSQIDIFVPLKPIDPKTWSWITRQD